MESKGKKGRANAQLAQQLMAAVVLRYAAPGHLRFDLPAELDAAGVALRERLMRVEGVYRVSVFGRLRKLSIRFDEAVCSRRTVALALGRIVGHLAAHPAELAGEPEPRTWKERVLQWGPIRRARDKARDVRQKGVIAAQVIGARVGMEKLPFDPKEWGLAFANDLVAFYLIKQHWDRITKQWLPDPIKYRYQWLTVIYLVFLLVRSRKAAKLPRPGG